MACSGIRPRRGGGVGARSSDADRLAEHRQMSSVPASLVRHADQRDSGIAADAGRHSEDPVASRPSGDATDDRAGSLTRPIENISDPRYVKALSHPLRVRILAILDERVASPLELSRMLRTELGVVAYHVRTLHRLGLIALERETKVRGATQRHYKAIERPRISNEAWAKAPPI